jgi:mannosidase alpha-like ER degradation enhancer 1
MRATVDCGLAGIQDLRTNQRDDRMESFVLSETLKATYLRVFLHSPANMRLQYLYLLFDEDNPINSDDSNYVFTTEGHILTMDTHHMRPLSLARRKLRGPEKSQCPAYHPWILVEDYPDSSSGLMGGLRQRSDVDYARTLVGVPATDADATHWSVDGWCQVPPLHVYVSGFTRIHDNLN